MFQNITAVVLAAGCGRRMGTALPKPLHPVAGEPVLSRILRALSNLPSVQEIRIAVRPDGARLIAPIAQKYKALMFEQSAEDPGTAGAVRSIRPEEAGDLLILSGDHPLITSKDLSNFLETGGKSKTQALLGVFERPDPGSYGRVVLEKGFVQKIVEKEEAGPSSQKALVNAGLYLIQKKTILKFLPQIQKNPNGESNLTCIMRLIHQNRQKGQEAALPCPVSWRTAFGVNTQKELYLASIFLFERKREALMDGGVIFPDAGRTYVESQVHVGSGTILYPGAYLKGRTQIGSFCAVEPGVFVADSVIHDFTSLKAGSYIEGAVVGEKSSVGPSARIRGRTRIGKECRVGNFVEIKNSVLEDKTKAGHFSYIGDSVIGKSVNIGAGAVTCNYGPDRKKRKTVVHSGAFIGSGAQLVAPVTVGAEAVVAAGSVITKNVPKGSLALARGEQKTISDYRKK